MAVARTYPWGFHIQLSHDEVTAVVDGATDINAMVDQAAVAIPPPAGPIVKTVAQFIKLALAILHAVDKGKGVYISMLWAAPGLFIPTTSDNNPPPADPPSEQADWAFCHKCKGLHYGPGVGSSVCPAGGQHSLDGSANYILPVDATKISAAQDGWRWCNRCQILAYKDGPNVCPAGGMHDFAGSGDYQVRNVGYPELERDWSWCAFCGALFHVLHSNKGGRCPAHGSHNGVDGSAVSDRYFMVGVPRV